MYTEKDLVEVFDRFYQEKKFGQLEAVSLWARNIQADHVRKALTLRYGDAGLYDEAVQALEKRGFNYYGIPTEDTRIVAHRVINRLVMEKLWPQLIAVAERGIKTLTRVGRRFLYLVIESGKFESAPAKSSADEMEELERKRLLEAFLEGFEKNQIWSRYYLVFKELPTEAERRETINDLVRAGIIEFQTQMRVYLPPFFDQLVPVIKESGLPKVVVVEEV